MKKKSFLKIGLFSLILAVAMLFMLQDINSQQIVERHNNPQILGWMFGKDASFAGERAWGYSGTLDTLVVSGVDITCSVYLTPKTATGTLRYDIKAAGDTIFVTSSGSETASSDKYAYLIVRNAYGATD